MPPSPQGRAPQAARHKGSRFRTLSGMLHADVLTQGWPDIRKAAAAGVEHGRAQASAQPLAANLHALVERLTQKRSRTPLVRRPARPTGDGPQRPLGIPAVEDQLLPLAVARLLEAIDAQAFLRGSSGYRPHVGALDAVDTRTINLPCGRYAWVVEAALTTFLDTIDHDWMGRMLAERLDDGALLRLSRQGLKAGGRDTDGQVLHPVTGTPPGGTVSLPPKWPTCWESFRRVCHGHPCAPALGTGFAGHRSRGGQLWGAQRHGSKEGRGARRQHQASRTLEGRRTFAPSRGRAACVGQADARVGPITRRPAPQARAVRQR